MLPGGNSAKAAEARVKYFEAYRAYLKRWHRYTQENMYWREAQYEDAKATPERGRQGSGNRHGRRLMKLHQSPFPAADGA